MPESGRTVAAFLVDGGTVTRVLELLLSHLSMLERERKRKKKKILLFWRPAAATTAMADLSGGQREEEEGWGLGFWVLKSPNPYSNPIYHYS